MIYQYGLHVIYCIFILLTLSIYIAPYDVVQGPISKVMYLHVPLAIASLLLFCVVLVMSTLAWVYHIKVASHIASIAARCGTVATAITLISGMIWGYYTWGTFWVWEPRLTTYLMLLFIYLAYLIMDKACQEYLASKQSLMLLSIIGVMNVILVHVSVNWWQSLHQQSSLLEVTNGALPIGILLPLLLSILFFALVVTYICARHILIKLESIYES